jgi:hypothetical protein
MNACRMAASHKHTHKLMLRGSAPLAAPFNRLILVQSKQTPWRPMYEDGVQPPL